MCFDIEEEVRESEDLEQRVRGVVDTLKSLWTGGDINAYHTYVHTLYNLTQNRVKHVRKGAEIELERIGARTRKEGIPFCDKCGLNMVYTQTRSEFGYEKDFYDCPVCSDYVKVGEEENGTEMIPKTIYLSDGLYLE